MHPHNRTSRIQALQMCIVNQANVHNIAVEGSFDDCQGIMKTIFNQLEFKKHYELGAVNSVNWGRLLAQTVYYFYAYFQATEKAGQKLSFFLQAILAIFLQVSSLLKWASQSISFTSQQMRTTFYVAHSKQDSIKRVTFIIV